MGRKAGVRRRGRADLLLAVVLAWGGVAQGGVLYRCAGAEGPPRWQQRPCAEGEAQRTLEYVPQPAVPHGSASEPAAARAPATGPRPQAPSRASRSRTAQPAVRSAVPTRASSPRRSPAQERAEAACRAATLAARERSDGDGRRLPLRTIRAREREAALACRR